MAKFVATNRFGNKLVGRCIAVISILSSLQITGCSKPNTLESIYEEGVLHVVTRNSPTTYYHDRHGGVTGLEYELAKGFADELGVRLTMRSINSFNEMYDQLDQGDAYFAAAGLTVTDNRQKSLDFSSQYLEVKEQVVYNIRNRKPRKLEDLIGKKISVIAGSSHATHLAQIKADKLPNLEWTEVSNESPADLLQKVIDGDIDYTIMDSNELSVHQSFFPRVKAAFNIGDVRPIAWAFPKSSDTSLYEAAEQYFARISSDGTLEQLKERFYGHIDGQYDYYEARNFLKRTQDRLIKYKDEFKKAARSRDLDWRLLAAVGYQESHWEPDAISPTGVKGLMMLTRVTAKEVGIKDRTDGIQSIQGGAEYLARLRKRIEPHIQEPDRTWFSLAAYNVGLGHLNDARMITEQLGADPDKWMDVKEHLPLLTQEKWFKKTRYGYARGYEPVNYVQNIRRFYDVLVWYTQTYEDKEYYAPSKQQKQLALVNMQRPILKAFPPML